MMSYAIFMLALTLSMLGFLIYSVIDSKRTREKRYEEFVDELESKYNLTGHESYMLWCMSKGL